MDPGDGHSPPWGSRSFVELHIAMYPTVPIVRPANAARFATVGVRDRCLRESYRQFAFQAMLGLGAAACIICQHGAMPPRQPCSSVIALAQIQSWGS